jgi:hypothetical protein
MIYQIIFILTVLTVLLLISFKKNKENFDCSSCITEISNSIRHNKGDKGPKGGITNGAQNGYKCQICKGCSQSDYDQCLLGRSDEFSPIDVSTPTVSPGNQSRCAAIDPKVLSLHHGPVIKTRVTCVPSGPRGDDGAIGEIGEEGDDGLPGEEGVMGPTPETKFTCTTCLGREDNCTIRCTNPYLSNTDESRDCYDTGKNLPLFPGSPPEKIFSKIVCTFPDNIGDPGIIGERGPDGEQGDIGLVGEEGDDGDDISLKLNEEYYSLPDNISRENTRWDVGRYDGDLEWAGITDGKKSKMYTRSTNTSNLPRHSGYIIPNILDRLDTDSNSDGPKQHLENRSNTCPINNDIFELVRRDAKCNSSSTNLSESSNIQECAKKCKDNDNCKYFTYGKDSHSGKCFMQTATNDLCTPNGISVDNKYNLYKIKSEEDSGCFFKYDGKVEALDYNNSLPYKEPLSIGKTYLSIHEFDVLKKVLKYY